MSESMNKVLLRFNIKLSGNTIKDSFFLLEIYQDINFPGGKAKDR